MSANNWRKCPRCGGEAAKKRAEADALYGKITKEKYNALIAEADALEDGHTDTLREDWEFYYEKPFMLTVSYGCSCKDCWLTFSLRKEFDIRKDSRTEGR